MPATTARCTQWLQNIELFGCTKPGLQERMTGRLTKWNFLYVCQIFGLRTYNKTKQV